MRHFFLLCTLLLATCSLWGHEQEKLVIKESYVQITLEEVFKDLHKKYQVFFSYRKKQISDIKISVDIPESSLSVAMQLILKGTSLDYEILDERFVLIKPKEGEVEEIPYICGWVLDSLSEDAISFANLSIPSEGKGAVSQTDGSFYIKGKIPFEAEVIISSIGYENKRLSFGELRKGPCAPILLQPQTLSLKGLEISEYLTDGISQDPISIKLSPGKVSTLPGLTEPDIFQMAQVLPGINSPDETAAGLHIRGGTPDQTLVMIEGMPLYQTGHFFDMISSVNPYAIDEARVSRSGFDVSRAGRVSGAIDLSQGNAVPDKLGLGLAFNLTHMGFDLQAPLLKKKMALLFSSRRSTTDFFPTLTFSRLQDRVFQGTRIGWLREFNNQTDYFNVDFERFAFNDWNFKWLYNIKDKHQLSFSSFNGRNQLNYHVSIEPEDEFLADDLEILNSGFSFNWTYKDSLKYVANTRLSFSEYNSRYSFTKQDFERSFDFEVFGKRNNVKDNRLTSDHQWFFGRKHSLKAGFMLSSKDVAYELDFKAVYGEFQDTRFWNGETQTFYGSYVYSPNQKFYLEGGLRFSGNSLFERAYTAPRLQLSYQLTSGLKFRLHTGIYRQFISQLIEWEFDPLGFHNQVWVLSGDNFIPAIQSYQINTGFLYDKKEWMIDLELYHKAIFDLTSLTTSFQNFAETEYSTGLAKINGLDFLLKRRWRAHRFWLSYTLSQILYDFEDISEVPFFAPHDQRHNFKFIQLYQFNNWQFSVGWTYRSGKPFTPRIGDEIEFRQDDDEEIYVVQPILGESNGQRLRAYHRLDASIMYQFPASRERSVKGNLGLSLLNVYDRENILSIRYFPEYYAPEDLPDNPESEELVKTMLRFMPNLVIRLRW